MRRVYVYNALTYKSLDFKKLIFGMQVHLQNLQVSFV